MSENRSPEQVKVKKSRIGYLVKAYLVNGNVIQQRLAVLASDGKLYLVKKRLFGYKIDKNEQYLVKPEHIILEQVKKGHVLAVYLDPREKISLPAPQSNAPAWRREELELAQKVVSNVLILRQLEEERRRLMQLMGRMQLIMLGMFILALIFAGVLYYMNAHTLIDQIQNILHQIFPSPQPLPSPTATPTPGG